ncbi:MAG TPA: CPBP family glutamic-type intramembrane protease [Acidimicrobiia bacterium]|nr:CPBP family glutamic-type intramembrane protease [Acidimicrobiia bacterium]
MQSATSVEPTRRVETPIRTDGWSWRWTGWASWPVSPAILAVATAALALDVASAWAAWPPWYAGRVLISPALPLAAVLVALVGWRRVVGDRATRSAWREFVVGGALTALVAVLAMVHSVAGWGDMEGVTISAVGEEVVYRLAAVLVIGAACARLAGREWRDTASWGTGPVIAGLVGAAGLFSVLPGHVEQMTGAENVLPFASLAMLLGYVAFRTGSLLPGAVVHVLLDVVTLGFFAGVLSAPARAAVAAATLTALVLGLMIAGRRLGLRRRLPAVIDLREQPPGVA